MTWKMPLSSGLGKELAWVRAVRKVWCRQSSASLTGGEEGEGGMKRTLAMSKCVCVSVHVCVCVCIQYMCVCGCM